MIFCWNKKLRKKQQEEWVKIYRKWSDHHQIRDDDNWTDGESKTLRFMASLKVFDHGIAK